MLLPPHGCFRPTAYETRSYESVMALWHVNCTPPSKHHESEYARRTTGEGLALPLLHSVEPR